MKTIIRSIASVALLLVAYEPCAAQVKVWHQGIEQVSVDMRGASVVLAQLTINLSEAGSVLVQFDGECISSPGDRIALAASNTPTWHVNDGTVAVEAYDGDVTARSFSHSRVYPVSAGAHSFYAVGENSVEMDGSGIAHVYGSLTIKFFPNEVNKAFVSHTGIVSTNQNVRGASTVIAQETINVSVSGDALVRFDGVCMSAPGDLIVLATSNTTSWSPNDGNTLVEAIDSDLSTTPFSHSRMYPIGPGSHDFYALAQNYVELDGDGIVDIYGSLTVEFFPGAPGDAFVQHTGISETGVYIEGGPAAMGQLTINPTTNGTAVIRFEGLCVSSVGDRIIAAASDHADWETNDGNVGLEAVSIDIDSNPFSHSRAYAVDAGSHTFYAVCENYVETDGDGIASLYASLSVEFIPGDVTAVGNDRVVPAAFGLEQNYPNPFNPETSIAFDLPEDSRVRLIIYDLMGHEVERLVDETMPAGRYTAQWRPRGVASGVYFCRMFTETYEATRRLVLLK